MEQLDGDLVSQAKEFIQQSDINLVTLRNVFEHLEKKSSTPLSDQQKESLTKQIVSSLEEHKLQLKEKCKNICTTVFKLPYLQLVQLFSI